MKQAKHISKLFSRQLPLMVVLLAAFVFSASNGLRPLLTTEIVQASKWSDDSGEEEERPQTYVEAASNALVPVVQISFLHQPVLPVPAPPVVVQLVKTRILPPLRADEFFKTLFRLIISPNAP